MSKGDLSLGFFCLEEFFTCDEAEGFMVEFVDEIRGFGMVVEEEGGMNG